MLAAIVLVGCLAPFSFAAEPTAKVTLPSCLDRVECVFITAGGGWPDEVRRVPSLGPARVIEVSARTDDARTLSGSSTATPWTTDQWVFGWRVGSPVAFEMPLDCGLKDLNPTPKWPTGWPRLPLGKAREGSASRFDAGGNILVAPGPKPRIVTSAQLQPAIRKGLQQALGEADCKFIELDTSWLKVGHVDEIVGFVPGGNAGFRLVLPDYVAGLRLLQSVPADRVLFGGSSGKTVVGTVTGSGARFLETDARGLDAGKWKYVRIISGPQAGVMGRVRAVADRRLVIDLSWDLRGESPTRALDAMREWQCETMPLWIEPPEPGSRFVAVEDSRLWLDGRGVEVPAILTVGELIRDKTFEAVTRACAERIDGPGGVRETMLHALGLSPAAIVRLPALVRGNEEARNATALLPNPANAVCVENDVLLLRPHGPRLDPDDASSDVFARAWSSELRRIGLNPVFLEGWDALHRLEGGAHCGINVLRRPRAAP